jgi:hypothetical protein
LREKEPELGHKGLKLRQAKLWALIAPWRTFSPWRMENIKQEVWVFKRAHQLEKNIGISARHASYDALRFVRGFRKAENGWVGVFNPVV